MHTFGWFEKKLNFAGTVRYFVELTAYWIVCCYGAVGGALENKLGAKSLTKPQDTTADATPLRLMSQTWV